jgi:hypothetical protein
MNGSEGLKNPKNPENSEKKSSNKMVALQSGGTGQRDSQNWVDYQRTSPQCRNGVGIVLGKKSRCQAENMPPEKRKEMHF